MVMIPERIRVTKHKISDAVIIGYGSIGKRHREILIDLGINVAVLSSRKHDIDNSFTSYDEVEGFDPDYVIIASSTENHFSDLEKINQYCHPKAILVEKPIFSELPQEIKNTQDIKKYDSEIFVGYNLRFHPIISRLKDELKGQKILSAHMYVGQYLPDWRPDRNHKETYSSIKEKGGGVLRDLSHELDLAQYLFGKNIDFKSIGGRFSDITVDSDDVYCFVMSNEECKAISMQMNYLDRVARREAIINTEDNSYKYDLVNSVLEINGSNIEINSDRNISYINMHKAIIEENHEGLCSINDGVEIMHIICEAEKDND